MSKRSNLKLCPCVSCGGVILQPPHRVRLHAEQDLRAKSGTRGVGKRAQYVAMAGSSRSELDPSTSTASKMNSSFDIAPSNPPNASGTDTMRSTVGHSTSAQLAIEPPSALERVADPLLDLGRPSSTSSIRAVSFDLWQPSDMDTADDSVFDYSPPVNSFISALNPSFDQSVLSHAAEIAALTAAPPLSQSPLPRILEPQRTQMDAERSRGPWLACEHVQPVSLHPADFVATIAAAEQTAQAAAATAVPLTAHTAHTKPKPTESEKRITRQARRLMQQAEADIQAAQAAASVPQPNTLPDDSLADVGEPYSEDEISANMSDSEQTHLDGGDGGDEVVQDVDEPDPFFIPPPEDRSTAFTHLNDIILSICTIVSWLFFVHHLPRKPADVLMRFFKWMLLQLGYPDLAALCPMTVNTAAHRLGIDVEVYNMPVCPSCKEVHPVQEPPDNCALCETYLWRDTKTKIPAIKYPYSPLQQHLERVLVQPGMEKMLDSWRTVPRTAGKLVDVFDGRVTQSLLGPDGQPFFRNNDDDKCGPDGELRLGLMWGIDWFSHIVSNIAPSHSSCLCSFTIANLPVEHRYRAANLLCTSILPGPKEQSGDEIQRFIRPVINELLRLWKDGFTVETPDHPQGRKVRVILIAVCCDKPAAHKVGGFGAVGHRFFCHCCWIKREDLATPAAFIANAFPAQTDARHRELGEQYRKLKEGHDKFVREHSTRFAQLSRLPYFNTIRQVVVDPMHNLALGLVKAQFYHIWVQQKILDDKKLRVLHQIMQSCEVPDHLGRLPNEIGVPAGGSLTADQWIILATIMGPLLVPMLWLWFTDDDGPDRLEAVARFEKKKVAAKQEIANERERKEAEKKLAKDTVRERKKARRPGKEAEEVNVTAQTESTPPEPSAAKTGKGSTKRKVSPDDKYHMHAGDVDHFLKLSQALHLLLRRELTLDSLNIAEVLLREYCGEIAMRYGTSAVRPNHHYATHVVDYARDFGPLCGFWTFLFERLNRILKNFNTNKHGNGDLEETFLRGFLRQSNLNRMTTAMKFAHPTSLSYKLAQELAQDAAEDRGTVADLAQLTEDLESAVELAADFSLSRHFVMKPMDNTLYAQVLQLLRQLHPDWQLYSRIASRSSPTALQLSSQAHFFHHVVWHGKRFVAASMAGTSRRSFACARVMTADGTFEERACLIQQIVQFQQASTTDSYLWLQVDWFTPFDNLQHSEIPPAFRSFERIRLWQADVYDISLPPLIELGDVLYHVGMFLFEVGEQVVWATLGIDKVRQTT